MASILDKYGIKEVADVVFYELDSEGAPSAPSCGSSSRGAFQRDRDC